MADANHKRCLKCGEVKTLSEFYLHSNGRPRSSCKLCTNKSHSRYVLANAEKVAAYKKRWSEENAARLQQMKCENYRNNAAAIKMKVAAYATKNPERVREYKAKWKKDNPQKAREYQFVRYRVKKGATPIWADREAMLALFRKAQALSKTTGIDHHVDHIVPLTSKFVCGLHCEQNMQILKGADNLSKLNRWWPDMWPTAEEIAAGKC